MTRTHFLCSDIAHLGVTPLKFAADMGTPSSSGRPPASLCCDLSWGFLPKPECCRRMGESPSFSPLYQRYPTLRGWWRRSSVLLSPSAADSELERLRYRHLFHRAEGCLHLNTHQEPGEARRSQELLNES